MKNVSRVDADTFAYWFAGKFLRGARHSKGQQSARVNKYYAQPAGTKLRRKMAQKTLGLTTRGY